MPLNAAGNRLGPGRTAAAAAVALTLCSCVEVATVVEHTYPQVITDAPFGTLQLSIEGRNREIADDRWETRAPWTIGFAAVTEPTALGAGECRARLEELQVESIIDGEVSVSDPALANTVESVYAVTQWTDGLASAPFVASGFDSLELNEQRVTVALSLEGDCGTLRSGRTSIALRPRTTTDTVTLWDRLVNAT